MDNMRRRPGRPSRSSVQLSAESFIGLTSEQKRAVFIDAAARLFEAYGYANTSIEDITTSLGVSKGIFYYYWANKKELINEIHSRVMVLHNEELDQIIATESTPDRRLESAIRSHLTVVLDNKSLIATLMKEAHYPTGVLADRRSYTARLQQLFEAGIAAGVVRKTDARVLTFAILGLCRSIVQWYEPNGRLDRAEVIEIFVRLAVDGYAQR
jgi:TetR/AcrR family transcriptional regulator, cholesterol catabolism regulator